MDTQEFSARLQNHLANERTYLAWVRTAVGGIALGIALERFARDDSESVTLLLAGVVLALSVLLLLWSTRRYYQVARDLESNSFVVDRWAPAAIATAGIVLAMLVVALTF